MAVMRDEFGDAATTGDVCEWLRSRGAPALANRVRLTARGRHAAAISRPFWTAIHRMLRHSLIGKHRRRKCSRTRWLSTRSTASSTRRGRSARARLLRHRISKARVQMLVLTPFVGTLKLIAEQVSCGFGRCRGTGAPCSTAFRRACVKDQGHLVRFSSRVSSWSTGVDYTVAPNTLGVISTIDADGDMHVNILEPVYVGDLYRDMGRAWFRRRRCMAMWILPRRVTSTTLLRNPSPARRVHRTAALRLARG